MNWLLALWAYFTDSESDLKTTRIVEEHHHVLIPSEAELLADEL